MKTFYWLVKREFWEHRGSFLWAPIITGAILLTLNLLGIVTAEIFTNRSGININGLNLGNLAGHLDAERLQEIEIGRAHV